MQLEIARAKHCEYRFRMNSSEILKWILT